MKFEVVYYTMHKYANLCKSVHKLKKYVKAFFSLEKQDNLKIVMEKNITVGNCRENYTKLKVCKQKCAKGL